MGVKHEKAITIADWTQIDLDKAIANKQFPVGTTLNDIALNSDFNKDHKFTGGAVGDFLKVGPNNSIISGAGGSPAGSNGAVQYNNNGAFGGDSGFSWNDIGKTLTLNSNTLRSATGSIALDIGSSSFAFVGSAGNDYITIGGIALLQVIGSIAYIGSSAPGGTFLGANSKPVGVGTLPDNNFTLKVMAQSAATVGQAIQLLPGQYADAWQVRDSTNTVISSVDAYGSISGNNISARNAFYFPNSDLLMYATAAVNDVGNAYSFTEGNTGQGTRQIKASSIRLSTSLYGAVSTEINNMGQVFIANSTEPATPTGGVVMYATNNAINFKFPDGNVKTIASI